MSGCFAVYYSERGEGDDLQTFICGQDNGVCGRAVYKNPHWRSALRQIHDSENDHGEAA